MESQTGDAAKAAKETGKAYIGSDGFEVDLEQISLFDTVRDDDVVKELEELDISNMTPMDAMNTLYRLQNRLKNRW